NSQKNKLTNRLSIK
ncbi:hypothetical protein VCHENC02_3628B, partial [Vibrio harveyi]